MEILEHYLARVERWRKAGTVIFSKTNVPIWLAAGMTGIEMGIARTLRH